MYKNIILSALLLCSYSLAFAQNKTRVDACVDKGETWLSDRLQMRWQTQSAQQFMKGEEYVSCDTTDKAPYPTLIINSSRSHATPVKRPALTDVEPRTEIDRPGNHTQSINKEIVDRAWDAAQLWQKSGEEKYLKAAASVLDVYMMGVLYTKLPYDTKHGHMQTLYGLQTQEVIHEETLPKLCLIYNALRYKLSKEQQDNYEKAFKHWADIIEKNGVPHNNWDLMQARFIFNVGQILQPNSEYEDGKGQQHYFDIVETGRSVRQWSLKTLTDYGYKQGFKGDYPANDVAGQGAIWSECPGYSQVVMGDLAEFVRLYKEQLGRDLTKQLPIIVDAAKTNVEYLYPDSMTIGFGDTHPARLNPDIYKKLRIDMNTLKPSRTFTAPGTSWLIQRTGMDRDRSLAFAINGSLGNHMHANGISLELFGRGQRLAPDAGIGYSLYSGDDYKEWYSQFPSHNTVCVNGVSSYPVMMSQHAIDIVSNRLTVLEDGTQVQYAIVNFTEPETHARQQRVVAMVSCKEDDGDGYFIDVFRSKTDGKKQFHDYFYHNMGQTLQCLNADGTAMTMQPTDLLAFAGGYLYAYSYIHNKVAATNDKDAIINYSINGDSIMMQQYAKGEAERTLINCLSPSTEGLSRMKNMPYDIRNSPTLTYVARQQGEAWTRPFANVFVPASRALPGSVKEVAYPEVRITDKVTTSATAFLITHTDGRQELIVTTDNPQARVRVKGRTFNGMFNIARIK